MEDLTAKVAVLDSQLNLKGGLCDRVTNLENAERDRQAVETKNFKTGIAILSAVSAIAGFIGTLLHYILPGK